MPKVQATPDQIRNLVAYLAGLKGDAAARSTPLPLPDVGNGVDFAEVVHPKEGEWPSYNGNIGGNRFGALTEINTSNTSR